MVSVLAVSPSIDPHSARNAARFLSRLQGLGAECLILANSRAVAELAGELEVPVADMGSNLGFGRAINAVAGMRAGWRWILLLNDDLGMTDEVAERMIGAIIQADKDDRGLLLFDPGEAQDTPDLLGTFLNVSNLARLAHRGPSASKGRRPQYSAFSAAAVSATAWDRLGGFSEDIPFCYEDADFVNRYYELLGGVADCIPLTIRHEGSRTTRTYVDEVVPAVAWSAARYLVRIGHSERTARRVVGAALLARAIGAVFARADTRAHVRGVLRAANALHRGAEPRLPSYDRAGRA